MLRILILLAWVVSLALSAPGHMSVDSLMQLLEGRTGIYAGAHPPLMSALLGMFDRIVPGTALYLVFASALFYLPLMALAGGDRGRSAMNWLYAAVLACLLATPLLLIYQGIVWKDVLFANLTLATFTCLTRAARAGARAGPRAGWLLLAAGLAALAASTRQNGLLVILFAALATGLMVPSPSRLSKRLGVMLLWGLLSGGAGLMTQAAVKATAVEPIGDGLKWGLTVVRTYDIVGMIAHGAPPFGASSAQSPEAERITALFRRIYDPSRVDTVDEERAAIAAYLQQVGGTSGQWWPMVRENPGAWLKHRADVFRWIIAPPDVRRCLPVWVGVDGLDRTHEALGIKRQTRPQDVTLYMYATKWLATPLFINATWMILAVALAGVLVLRRLRVPGDIAIAALLASAVAFAASFALIGIACDVRYLFLLPVACCGALAHLANPGRHTKSGRSLRDLERISSQASASSSYPPSPEASVGQ